MARLGKIWADGIWNTAIWNTAIWAQSGAADATAPNLVSAIIVGDSLRLTFDEEVTFGANGNTGIALTLSGGACTATYSSGDTSTRLIYSLSRTPATDETGTIDYTQPGNGIEDIAGNDLDSIVSGSISIIGTITSSVRMHIGTGIHI